VKAEDFRKTIIGKDGYLPTNAQEGLNILMKHFLGNDWYVVDPIRNDQVNSVVIYEILKKYPSGKFRRICKK
jgi:hypothetical protein